MNINLQRAQQSLINYKKEYFPGKWVVLTNEYFNVHKKAKDNNNIAYWKDCAQKYFNEKCSYCYIMTREHSNWTFNSGFKTLPLIFKLKYDENLTLLSAELNDPEEYIDLEGKYLLIINNFTKIEKISDNLVTSKGVLRILFDSNFKIEIYEFLSRSHEETAGKDLNCSLVNDFGITPQFSRTWIIAEALTDMNSSIEEFIMKFENKKETSK